MDQLKIKLLGPPQFILNDAAIILQSNKSLGLLAYLAVTGTTQLREHIANLFWGNSTTPRALAALRTVIWKIKKAGLEDFLEIQPNTICLRKDSSFSLDINLFHLQLDQCRSHGHPVTQICSDCLPRLEQAGEIYRGEFMEGFGIADGREFDIWCSNQREVLHLEIVSVLERLTKVYTAQGSFDQAIQYAKRWLELDPYQEEAHRVLMALYANIGQRAAAVHQYMECLRILEDDLRISPENATTNLYQAIQSGVTDIRPTELSEVNLIFYPLLSPINNRPHNLPSQPTPFLGREKELADLSSLLSQPNCRMVTIIGVGGVGKTRLALQVGAQVINNFKDGVYVVSLASTLTADRITTAIIESLNLVLSHDDREGQLSRYLHEKEMLLVFDNFEHLHDGVTLILRLISEAPKIKILTTSRQRLDLAGEWNYEIHGLSYPYGENLDQFEQYSAVMLFLQTAQRVRPEFTPTKEDKIAINNICQLLDGLPLGIELAASWVRALSCTEITQEITNNLDFLQSTRYDLPDRHRSLRAVFEHSWTLLSEEDRRILRRLSVFRNVFQREAALKVANASLLTLTSLLDKSMLRYTASGSYEILEIIRQYSEEQLYQVPEEQERTRARHSDYFAEYIFKQEKLLYGKSQMRALREIRINFENIHLAWLFAIDHQQYEKILKFIPSIYSFVEMQSLYKEGEEIIRYGVDKIEGDLAGDKPVIYYWLLGLHGWFQLHLSYYQQGLRKLDDCVLFGRKNSDIELLTFFLAILAHANEIVGNVSIALQQINEVHQYILQSPNTDDQYIKQKLAYILYVKGRILSALKKSNEARRVSYQSLEIYKLAGNNWGTARVLNLLGNLAVHAEDYPEAKALRLQSLRISQEIGDQLSICAILNNLGDVCEKLGEYDLATQYLEQSIENSIVIGDRRISGTAHINLGFIYYFHLNNPKEAVLHYQKGVEQFREIGHTRGLAYSLRDLGMAYLADEEPQKARNSLSDAIKLAWELNDRPMCLYFILAYAEFFANQNNYRQALELVTLVAEHSETLPEQKDQASKLKQQYEKRFDTETIQSIRQNQSVFRLEKVILGLM